MENETEYFTATITNSPSNLEGEVTILVDEDGEMVLDITQTLSNIKESEEGSVVIITTNESNVLNDSVVTYNVLPEGSRKSPLSFPYGDTYVVQGTPSPNASQYKNKESVTAINNVSKLKFFFNAFLLEGKCNILVIFIGSNAYSSVQ